MLSRPPLLTPQPGEFETSYYFYQRRLNDRLALPFTRFFYFKRGTPADVEWKRKQAKLAEKKYTGYGPRAWEDELLIGDERHLQADNGYLELVNSTVTGEDATEVGTEGEQRKTALEQPLGRDTVVDFKGNRSRLDRAMDRTLYLLVKRSSGYQEFQWQFPQSPLAKGEDLREVGT